MLLTGLGRDCLGSHPAMRLVPVSPGGEIKWGQAFEVASLEAYALERNQWLATMGIRFHEFKVVSERRIEYRSGGILVETYHVCENGNPPRLLEDFKNAPSTSHPNPSHHQVPSHRPSPPGPSGTV